MSLAGTFFSDRASMAGKVAMVTGAASGIGLEFARRCCADFGMHVVMGDVDGEALERAAAELQLTAAAKGEGSALAVTTDVRKREDIEALLAAARSATPEGCVDAALFNAGVLGAGVNVLKGSEADWRWVLDVNLFGILHGLQVFTPVVAAQARPCLIAATASTQGLDIGGPPGSTASYATSKHGIMAMMESLEGELAFKNLRGQVQLSVLCPGLVASGIWDVGKSESQRNPEDIRGVTAKDTQRQFFELGTSVKDTIATFLEGVKQGQFICDSVPGQAQEIFARRAEYIGGGMMPSDRRSKM